MAMVYRSSNYGHEDDSKNALSQQQSPAESLFSVVMDGYRQSGFLHTHCYNRPRRDAIVPSIHRPFPQAGELTFHPGDGFSDMTLFKLLQLPDGEDGESAMIEKKRHQDHIIIEPTPINIPDFQTVAQASGRFYTIGALSGGSGAPAMVHNKQGDLLVGSIGASGSAIVTLEEVPQRNVCESLNEGEKENLDPTNDDRRFRLYQSNLWNQRFQGLMAYQKRVGNCQPLTYIQDPPLTRWVK